MNGPDAGAPPSSWRVAPASALRGSITPPGDKSVSHRAVLLAAIARGTTSIEGWLPAEDCLATLSVLGRLGVESSFGNDSRTKLEVQGRGLGGLLPPASAEPLDCGNSGTTMRLALGILAAHPFRVTLTGDESLRRRPLSRVTEPLRMMGARIGGPDGGERAPLEIEGGPLAGRTFDLKIASAQVKSSLLLAGLHASGVTRVREPARSRDHTERQLERLGARYSRDEEGWHCVEGGWGFESRPQKVPGDISAAAFFVVGAVRGMRGELEVANVGVNPTRAGLLEVLGRMGARIATVNAREEDGEPVADLVVKGGASLKGVRVAGDMIPRLIDEIPVLAVAACFADGVTVIRDAGELRVKESDRLAATAGELAKMGAKIGVLPDGLAIEGGATLTGCEVSSHGDHRIAMALAIAALGAEGVTTITGTECVTTSYPGFHADLMRLTGKGP